MGEDVVTMYKGEKVSLRRQIENLRLRGMRIPKEQLLEAVRQSMNREKHSCRGRCCLRETRIQRKTCFCDAGYCEHFKDCCYDYHFWWGRLDSFPPSPQPPTPPKQFLPPPVQPPPSHFSIPPAPYPNPPSSSHFPTPLFDLVWLRSSRPLYLNHFVAPFFWRCNATLSIKSPGTCQNPNNPNQTWDGEEMIAECAPSHKVNTRGTSCFTNRRDFKQLEKEVPVVARETSRSYRSLSCALCNGITDVIPWKLQVFHCEQLLNVSDKIDWLRKDPDQCKWEYTKPDGHHSIRLCVVRMTRDFGKAEFDKHLAVVCELCGSYAMVFKFGNLSYRNPHCVLCDPNTGGKRAEDGNMTHGSDLPMSAFFNFATDGSSDPSKPNGTSKTTEGMAKGEQVITKVGCSLSIVSLLVLLVVYALFTELRNLPGQVLMNLACSIIGYQAALLSTGQTANGAACVAVGVLLHYFLLTSFMWMAVMGYDLAKTFTSNSKLSRI